MANAKPQQLDARRFHYLIGTLGEAPALELFVAAEGYLAHFLNADGTRMSLPELLSTMRGFDIEYADDVRPNVSPPHDAGVGRATAFIDTVLPHRLHSQGS